MSAPREEMIDQITGFLRSIGIPVESAALPEDTFLPGMAIRGGVLIYDPARDFQPGDLLHEAGHLAVADPTARWADPFVASDGDEMATLAWSWAAACHLGLPPGSLFHDQGYKGDGAWLAETFGAGHYPGLPLLQCYGMTVAPEAAGAGGPPPYPHMQRWVR